MPTRSPICRGWSRISRCVSSSSRWRCGRCISVGRQAEALRTYRSFADYLAEETGLDPSDMLVDLEHRILIGDPSLAPSSAVAVPGYELGDLIGEGAFGAVYRAVQPSLDREVAVKAIRAELADDPRFVQRFEAEAQLVARLEHPHVVPLYDFWRQPGAAFLVFRLLRGGSLADRIGHGPLSWREVSRMVGEIGGALAAAHALGMVHRDVKPANVLFDESGNSYLADFGIADGGGDVLDVALRSAGSPLYASPEQARDGVAGPASDQYSLAVVAWEALAGIGTVRGDDRDRGVRTKFTDRAEDLASSSDRTRRCDAVLQRASAPLPDDRYRDIAEFVHAWATACRRRRRDPDHRWSVRRTSGDPSRGHRSQPVARVGQPLQGSAGVPGSRRRRVPGSQRSRRRARGTCRHRRVRARRGPVRIRQELAGARRCRARPTAP